MIELQSSAKYLRTIRLSMKAYIWSGYIGRMRLFNIRPNRWSEAILLYNSRRQRRAKIAQAALEKLRWRVFRTHHTLQASLRRIIIFCDHWQMTSVSPNLSMKKVSKLGCMISLMSDLKIFGVFVFYASLKVKHNSKCHLFNIESHVKRLILCYAELFSEPGNLYDL